MGWRDVFLRLRRVPGAGLRHLLDIPALRAASARARARAQAWHAAALPHVGDSGTRIVAALTRDAICLADLGELGLASLFEDSDLQVALALLRAVAAHQSGRSLTRLHHGQLIEASGLYLAGLQPRLLNLAQAYFRLPAIYLGYELKVEHPDGCATGTRRWHRDIEDQNVLKLLVYLNDVPDRDGAFEYIDAAASARFFERSGYRRGFLAAKPAEESRTCPGPSGTAILFDGARLLHRARPPAVRERLSITFSYATRLARQVMPQQRPGRTLRRRVAEADPASVAVLP